MFIKFFSVPQRTPDQDIAARNVDDNTKDDDDDRVSPIFHLSYPLHEYYPKIPKSGVVFSCIQSFHQLSEKIEGAARRRKNYLTPFSSTTYFILIWNVCEECGMNVHKIPK